MSRRHLRTRPGRIDWPSNIIDVVGSGLTSGIHGAATQVVSKALFGLTRKSVPSGMARRRRKQRRVRRGRRRGLPGGVSRLSVRRVVPYTSTSGTAHRWYYTIASEFLVGSFVDTYSEFKFLGMSVRYLPNNATNETGLCVFVLLDRGGFGPYGAATAAAWFKTLGAMPGAKIRPRFDAITQSWRPTEPSARDWFSRKQSVALATCYVCNNGAETDELGGIFEISARVLARGLYYNATVTRELAIDVVGLYAPAECHTVEPDCEPAGTPGVSSPFQSLEICKE